MEYQPFEIKDPSLNPAETSAETALSPSGKLLALKKKNSRRMIVSAIALVVVTVVIFSTTSLAYFSDQVDSHGNVIASGNVEIALVETMDDGNGGTVTYTDPVRVMPATTVSQAVSVKNAGSLPVYVRVKLEKTVDDAAGMSAGWESKISCNINQTDWTLKDGYYYCNRPLQVGETTPPLFEEILFAASMGNEFVNKTVRFVVTSQATQADANGSIAWEAMGWPEEP